MPKTKPTPELPSNDLILAAIERAVCHRDRDEPESLSYIKEHLGLPHTGWTTQQLRPKLEALEVAGLIEQSRIRSRPVWGLTAKGRRRLDAVRDTLTLPEAPQHRIWREARATASDRIAGLRADLRGTLDEAVELLEAERDANSASWFEFSERLHKDGQQLATAIHCLREWAEPDDSKADTDKPPYRQASRRRIRG
ncbi:MAG TPA: hypothetical protein VFY36_06160 [Solirubrobacteraceae bacterium]|nr:hypothetical protein [Solirubrobacteraceae bacterium]